MDRSQNRSERYQTVARQTNGHKRIETTQKRKRIEIFAGAIQYLSKYIENLSAQTDELRQLL